MKPITLIAILFTSFSPFLFAQTAPDAEALTKLLNEFLAGASRNDAATHEKFWADDLIYTGSSGRRLGKAEIMKDVKSAPPPKQEDPTTIYSAEDIRIQQYGDTAIVAFRLVGTTRAETKTYVAHYLNSGTFLKRDGKWQVVNWQATRLPQSEEDAKAEIGEVIKNLHQAWMKSDAKLLAEITDEKFVWINESGEKRNREQISEVFRKSGNKVHPETPGEIQFFGETATVTGAGANPYTLTLLRRDGAWRLISMHTSRKATED